MRKAKSLNYSRVMKFRNKLQKERDIFLNLWEKHDQNLYDHFNEGGLDRFRIGKKHNYNIKSLAYIHELATYMAKHHNRDISYYLQKYGAEQKPEQFIKDAYDRTN